LLELDSLTKTHALQEAKRALAQQSIAYYRTKQGEVEDKLELAKAEHARTEAEVDMAKTESAMASLRLRLKLMLGLDLDRQIKVRPESLDDMMQKDNLPNIFAAQSWEEIWKTTPEARMLALSAKLHDYNVLVAWTRYLPTMTMDVQTVNPRSDYLAPSSDDEIFLSLNFSIPLLDWGARSRGVEKSYLSRVADSQRRKLARQTFAVSWKEAWQDTKMARAEVDLAREKVTVRELEKKKRMVEEQAGTGDLGLVLTAGMEEMDAKIALEEARLKLKNEEFKSWMTAGYFRQRFFEPYKEEDTKGAL